MALTPTKASVRKLDETPTPCAKAPRRVHAASAATKDTGTKQRMLWPMIAIESEMSAEELSEFKSYHKLHAPGAVRGHFDGHRELYFYVPQAGIRARSGHSIGAELLDEAVE